MLRAGVEVYTRLESSMGGERVNYANVFRHLEETTGVRVTYGSVHERIWDNQRDFQLDVIRTAAAELAEKTIIDMEGEAQRVLAAADLGSLEGRRQATIEVVRVLSQHNLESILASPLNRLQRSIEHRYSMLHEDNPERDEVREALLDGYRKSTARFTQTYENLLHALGLRPRRALFGDDIDMGVKALTSAGRIAIDGAILLQSVDPSTISMATGPNGELQEWTTAAFATFTTMCSLLELEGSEPLTERLI